MAFQRSVPFNLYRLLSHFTAPLWRAAISRRKKRGKEDPERAGEKLGHTDAPRPPGPLLWFHALSVGESLALLPLIELALKERPEMNVLLTTSTRTSAEALARVGLPDRVIHQFAPVDAAGPIRRFLSHWRPDAAIVTELDIWPATLSATRATGIPMVLVNSRMSDRNYAKRKKSPKLFRDALSLFDLCLLQDETTRERFVSLGVSPDRLEVVGALKGSARALPADDATLRDLQGRIGDRPVWLGASSEAREEPTLLEAHQQVQAQSPETLFILAPRNPSSADEAERWAKERFEQVARRSRGDLPDAGADVYIADTIGEMGLWYRLAPVTFVGHSLAVDGPTLRGKNPFEAAALGSMILHGPNVVDFHETYATLDEAGGAVVVDTADHIAQGVLKARDDTWREDIVSTADGVLAVSRKVLPDTWARIERVLTSAR